MAAKKFSVASKIKLLEFADSLRIMSIRRNKRGGLTTHRSHSIDPNVSYGQFSKDHGLYVSGVGLEPSKKGFHRNDGVTSMGQRKFSRACYNTLFVFAEFAMIISTLRSKRGGLTMHRSHFTVLNVSYRAFFKLMIPLVVIIPKKRSAWDERLDFNCRYKIFYDFPKSYYVYL